MMVVVVVVVVASWSDGAGASRGAVCRLPSLRIPSGLKTWFRRLWKQDR